MNPAPTSALIAWCEEMAAWCALEDTLEHARQFSEQDRRNWLACAAALSAQSSEVRRIDVLEEAAKCVEKIGHELMHEFGSYDDTTGVWEIHHRYSDRLEALDDAVEAIRKLQGTTPSATQRREEKP